MLRRPDKIGAPTNTSTAPPLLVKNAEIPYAFLIPCGLSASSVPPFSSATLPRPKFSTVRRFLSGRSCWNGSCDISTTFRAGGLKYYSLRRFECWTGTNLMQEPRTTLKTVLVAEDYADSRFILGRLLELSGYRVLEAADGREAVEIAEKESADVVLMDLQMPVLDGFTATSIIRRIEGICEVPIIAVSAQSTDDFVAAAKRVGCDHFVAKPVDFDLLLKLVRECTEGEGGRAYNATPKPVTIRQLCM